MGIFHFLNSNLKFEFWPVGYRPEPEPDRTGLVNLGCCWGPVVARWPPPPPPTATATAAIAATLAAAVVVASAAGVAPLEPEPALAPPEPEPVCGEGAEVLVEAARAATGEDWRFTRVSSSKEGKGRPRRRRAPTWAK